MKAAIDVLLATFQGEAFLPQQVESILAQTGVKTRILARDDGSRDRTPELLAGMQRENFRVLPNGTPTGSATGNFRLLLRESTAPYVALADQDDVWHSDKLRRSLNAMRQLEAKFGNATPLLVFTDLAIVDALLRPVAPSLWRHNGLAPAAVTRLGSLLGENVVTGCTALLNRPLAKLAAQMPAPPMNDPLGIQHDHWIALLACTLGRAAWIAESTIQYRQHGGNIVGAAEAQGSALQRLLGNTAFEARRTVRQRMQTQALTFLKTYHDRLNPRQQRTFDAYITLDAAPNVERLRRKITHGLWRGTLTRNLTDLADTFR